MGEGLGNLRAGLPGRPGAGRGQTLEGLCLRAGSGLGIKAEPLNRMLA